MKLIRFSLVIVLLFSFATSAFAAPLSGADTDLSIFLHEVGSSYNDDTTDAYDSDSAGDIDWPGVGGDIVYYGSTGKFSKIVFDVSSTSYMTFMLPTLSYWNGTSSEWITLSLNETTNLFASTGVGSFSWTVPAEWTQSSLNESPNYYYIRMQASGSQGAQVSQISVLAAATPVPEFSTVVYMVTLALGGLFVMKKYGLTKTA
ncbi:hypothetical protein KBD59_03005 [Candidatus Gracilibacteria bacterium]|nr:hypothetical protein [Candidatus Gracilibacteria bacterium]